MQVKVALIGFLGMSPAVMTELAMYLKNEGLTDIIMLPTKSKEVVRGARLVEAALNVRFPKIRVHIHMLPMEDVTTEKDNIIAAREMAKAICKELYQFNTKKIFLNVAGGRKETTIVASLLGMYLGVTEIYHVVNRDIKAINVYQEKIKEIIEKFENPNLNYRISIYKENKEELDYLLFPDMRDVEFIKVPIIPPTLEALALVKRILKDGGLDLMEEPIPAYNLEIYKAAGLITYDKYRVWPTDLGLEIGRMLRCEYR